MKLAFDFTDANPVVLLNKLRLTREIITATPALKLIALTATGTNNVDLVAAAERGE